ncbi:MAG: glycosyltransferase family 2 protein [Desulfobacterales bacterium]|nr:MAG: glycosyltransferase family 2 protein [Desulfobacterales bacterium]
MNAQFPLVSIGLPVYNSEKTIVRALDSLLAQNYPNFEIVISDNSSTDKTAEICRQYAERDNRIKFNINPKNLGINANFYIVYKMAAGKYFMWAGSDDFWQPDFIRTLVRELESDTRAGVALCAVQRAYPDGSVEDTVQFDQVRDPNNFSNWQMVANLLSPKARIKDRKYNLFICGLFSREAVRGTLDFADEILSYGERAFLSQIALAYKFRYVDEVLFVKTIYRQPFKERQPDDQYVQAKKRLSYLRYYYQIMVWTNKSPAIPWRRKWFVIVIPHYMLHKFIYKLQKRFRRPRMTS